VSAGIVWFRSDLRLTDNPAWASATAEHDRVVPLFVVDPALWDRSGAHRRDQLAAHLEALDGDLRAVGGQLHVVRGDPVEMVPAMMRAHGAESVHWNADVTPYAVGRDDRVAGRLEGSVREHHGRYVHPPGSIRTRQGDPYRVFTPFSKSWAAEALPAMPAPGDGVPTADPGDGVPEGGPPLMPGGERAAAGRLEAFVGRVDRYRAERDRPYLDTTSRISADLKFGTLGPRTVIERVGDGSADRRAFIRQLAWREFYAQLMLAYPHTVEGPLRPEYDAVAWREDPEGLEAWRQGQTGVPIVDAGMRQLRGEGWMHNRVRMLTASFLVKDLLIDWRLGERHFRRLLVDADVPQNVGNWQWVAGTGADAAPYFRILNPVTQGRKFDPDGAYVRRWVPELRDLAAPGIHSPWELGSLELEAAGVRLGEDYPNPIVDHAEARRETLAAYERAREEA